MRHEVVLSVEFANFEAGVAELREAVPEVLLILQKEDRELARRGATLWIRVLDREPANDLSLHYKCRLQHKGKPSSTCMPSKEQTSVNKVLTPYPAVFQDFSGMILRGLQDRGRQIGVWCCFICDNGGWHPDLPPKHRYSD